MEPIKESDIHKERYCSHCIYFKQCWIRVDIEKIVGLENFIPNMIFATICKKYKETVKVKYEISETTLKVFVKLLDRQFGGSDRCSCIKFEDEEIQIIQWGYKYFSLNLKKDKIVTGDNDWKPIIKSYIAEVENEVDD